MTLPLKLLFLTAALVHLAPLLLVLAVIAMTLLSLAAPA
jgi:hypothetical protein